MNTIAKKSTFNYLSIALSKSSKVWLSLIKSNLLDLALIILFVQAQGFIFLFYSQLRPDDQFIQILSQLSLSLLGMIEAVFVMVLIPLRIRESENNLPRSSYWQFFKKHISPLTIEGIRMLAYVILWGILLILPGMYKQMRWYLMPFVVMFDDKYLNGEIDCLERAAKLSEGLLFLIILITLSDLGIQWFIDNLALSLEGPEQYVAIVFSAIITMGISVYTYSLFYNLYSLRAAEEPYDE